MADSSSDGGWVRPSFENCPGDWAVITMATRKLGSKRDWALGSELGFLTTVGRHNSLAISSFWEPEPLKRAATWGCPKGTCRRSRKALLLRKFLAELAKSNLKQTKIMIRFVCIGLNHRSWNAHTLDI